MLNKLLNLLFTANGDRRLAHPSLGKVVVLQPNTSAGSAALMAILPPASAEILQISENGLTLIHLLVKTRV